MENCMACESLKENAANFLLNGITDKECSSLQNNTGLNPDLSVLHNNCEDLNNINDCLIGSLGDKLDAYDICQLKDYLKALTNNLYVLNQALLCSDCGQWNAIGSMENRIEKIIEKLIEIGVWDPETDDFKPGMGIAGGNINLFGGIADGKYWIRTNKGKTENDLAGGLNTVIRSLKEEVKQDILEELKAGD